MPPVSKIAQLPPEMRKWLHDTFVARAHGDIVQITDELNAMLREGGIATYVGKSAVGAESLKVKRAQEAVKATTEACKLVAQSSRDDGDSRSEAAMALVQTEVFELLLQIREATDVVDPVERLGTMKEAAITIGRLGRTRVMQNKWALEVEGRIKATADKVEQLARKGGMDARTVEEIRRSILGIKDTPKTANAAP